MSANCIVHPERAATDFHKVPCAPEGKVHVCAECAKPENLARVFAAYRQSHPVRIEGHKQRAKEGGFSQS